MAIGNQGGQRPVRQQQVQQPVQNQGYDDEADIFDEPSQPVQQPNAPKKKSKLPLIIILVLVAVVVVFVALKFLKGNGEQEQEETQPTFQLGDYDSSGRKVLDTLLNALITFDAETIDSVVGANPGDSYIAQEWAFVNGVQVRQDFIKKVCGLVQFKYPVSEDGINASMMNAGESMTVTSPDYAMLSLMMDEDVNYITGLYKTAGYTPDDYDFEEEMFNLYCQYAVDRANIPTKDTEMQLSPAMGIISSDASLDDLLFGSQEFHDSVKRFSQLCLGWTGYKDETYYEMEEQHNPDYDEWYAIFIERYNADGGKYNKRKSTWEPFYKRDENNKIMKDENGENIVEYYSIKRDDGTDWIQPTENVLVEVEKHRQVEDPWVEETGIPYCMVGTNFMQNSYTGSYSTAVRVGDGTKDRPAGIGTSIITKVLCDDGNYHDVRVTLLAYWTHQDAIDYLERFSSKNAGFTESSPIKFMTMEFEVENLEKNPITFGSEMTLCDANSNVSARATTMMYGLTSEATLQPGEKKIMNDWVSSTELELKYLAWGKSFNRQFQMVFFDVLAGTGEIPTYSAYKQFTGEGYLDYGN